MATPSHGEQMSAFASQDVEFIAEPEVLRIAGISHSELWRRVRAGTVPQPCRFGERCTRFVKSEWQAWARQRIDERDKRIAERQAQAAA